MYDQELTAINKAIVRSFYEGGTDSEAKEYGQIFHPDFKVTAPDYLPWGGISNLDEYLVNVLPQVTSVIDFSKCVINSLVAENEQIVIVVTFGVIGTPHQIVISEHWVIKDKLATSLWVAYFEPKAMVDRIAYNVNHY